MMCRNVVYRTKNVNNKFVLLEELQQRQPTRLNHEKEAVISFFDGFTQSFYWKRIFWIVPPKENYNKKKIS
jgi:hypothetical protein